MIRRSHHPCRALLCFITFLALASCSSRPAHQGHDGGTPPLDVALDVGADQSSDIAQRTCVQLPRSPVIGEVQVLGIAADERQRLHVLHRLSSSPEALVYSRLDGAKVELSVVLSSQATSGSLALDDKGHVHVLLREQSPGFGTLQHLQLNGPKLDRRTLPFDATVFDIASRGGFGVHATWHADAPSTGLVLYFCTLSDGCQQPEIVEKRSQPDDLTLVIDSRGKPHVAAISAHNPIQIYSTTDSPGQGRLWLSSYVLGGYASWEKRLAQGFAADDAGKLHLAWYRGQTFYATKPASPVGALWTGAATPFTEFSASLIADADDKMHMLSSTQSGLLHWRTRERDRWSAPHAIAQDAYPGSHIVAMDSVQGLHIVYRTTTLSEKGGVVYERLCLDRFPPGA